MTVFLLIVVFTMLVFLLVSLPTKKTGTETSADMGYLPGAMDGTTDTAIHHPHSGDCGHHGDAAHHSGGDCHHS